MPGVEQEKGGIIKRGGRFLNALVEADVAKVTITVRKSYGGAYAVMGSKQLSADLNFAWPTARIAVIGAEGAAQLLMKRFPDPNAPEAQEVKRQFIEGYNLNMRFRDHFNTAGETSTVATAAIAAPTAANRPK